MRAMDAEVGARGRSEVIREAVEAWLAQRRLAAQVERHRKGYRRSPVKREEFSPLHGAQVWPATAEQGRHRG